MPRNRFRTIAGLLIISLATIRFLSLPKKVLAEDVNFGASTEIQIFPIYWGNGSYNAMFRITSGYIMAIKTLKVLQNGAEIYNFDNSHDQIFYEWPPMPSVGSECHGASGWDEGRKLTWTGGDPAQDFVVQVIDSTNSNDGTRNSDSFRFSDGSQYDPTDPNAEKIRILTEFREPIDLILSRLKNIFPPTEGDFWFNPVEFPQLPLINDQYANNGGLKPEISQALGAIITNTYKGVAVNLDSGNLKLSAAGRNYVDQIHSAAAGVGNMIQALTNENVTDEEVAGAAIPFEIFGSDLCQSPPPQTFEDLKTKVASIITFGEMEFMDPFEPTGQDQCEAGFLGIKAARNLPGFILCLAGTLVNQIADAIRDLAFSLFEKYAGL